MRLETKYQAEAQVLLSVWRELKMKDDNERYNDVLLGLVMVACLNSRPAQTRFERIFLEMSSVLIAFQWK